MQLLVPDCSVLFCVHHIDQGLYTRHQPTFCDLEESCEGRGLRKRVLESSQWKATIRAIGLDVMVPIGESKDSFAQDTSKANLADAKLRCG